MHTYHLLKGNFFACFLNSRSSWFIHVQFTWPRFIFRLHVPHILVRGYIECYWIYWGPTPSLILAALYSSSPYSVLPCSQKSEPLKFFVSVSAGSLQPWNHTVLITPASLVHARYSISRASFVHHYSNCLLYPQLPCC